MTFIVQLVKIMTVISGLRQNLKVFYKGYNLVSSIWDSKGKCPLLSVIGPQKGWNDPPALNRVPKKKKVLEKDAYPIAYRCFVNHVVT